MQTQIQTEQALEFTGERMVPEGADTATFWEHVYRYRFAASLVRDKRVLDIACGEGYGAASLLKAGAAGVVGVDISDEACRHARTKYGLDVRVGRAEEIPLADQSVDVIVSFETIEHVEDPSRFIAECRRVLAPDGVLIISTPNKDIFKAAHKHSDYHCSEMTEDEFVATLSERFSSVELYHQMPTVAPTFSLRALALEHSFWTRTRGIGRTMKIARKALCPQVFHAEEMKHRASAIETILSEDTSAATLVNPYAIRPRQAGIREEPVYVLAVARAGA